MDVSRHCWFGSWSSLRLSTFVCALHPTEASCGPTGLPLTPHSIGALGRAQKLIDDEFADNPDLLALIDCIRGTHERLILVHIEDKRLKSLHALLSSATSSRRRLDAAFIHRVTVKVLRALQFLHSRGIVHATLEPRHILVDEQNERIVLDGFPLAHVTSYGKAVDFPIFNPRFAAPEILLLGHRDNQSSFEALTAEEASLSPMSEAEERPRISTKEQIVPPHPKCDTWSLGLILACMALGIPEPWRSVPVTQVLRRVLGLHSYKGNILHKLATDMDDVSVIDDLDPKVLQVIDRCLVANVEERASVDELLAIVNPDFCNDNRKEGSMRFPSMALRCLRESGPSSPIDSEWNPLYLMTYKEAYHLWKLAGGNVINELQTHTIDRRPSIMTMPSIVTKEGHFIGKAKERSSLFDPSTTQLSLDQLKSSLRELSPVDCFPLTLTVLDDEDCNYDKESLNSEDPSQLPLIIKEANVSYQFSRLVLYRRLLRAYPHQSERIRQEALVDVTPLYRAQIWACILGIQHDTVNEYDSIDKESWTPTDRQIDVDIPRCHQYNALLASSTGHMKLKRLLKAWVASHPQYVYWQGLDSLSAPFLILNMNDEALAYACLKAFIPKYLNHMFLRNNAVVIQEYLAKFSHLQAFEEPDLFNHLDGIGFIPELYAIPWILTMFSHVFPLHNIFHLWDQLLLGDNAFPLCIAMAILKQLKGQLMRAEFNECILLFTDLPAIDIDKCIKDSRSVARRTPKSITYRRHAYSKLNHKNELVIDKEQFTDRKGGDNEDEASWHLSSLSLEILKMEKVPRMEALELLRLLDKQDIADPIHVMALDVRPSEEYRVGTLAHNVTHLPVHVSDELDDKHLMERIESHDDDLVVICGSQSRESESIAFAHRLLRLDVRHVCLLHGGVDVFRRIRPNALIVPHL